jgi:hypothetical protein
MFVKRVARGMVLAGLAWLVVRPAGLAAQVPALDPHAVRPERPTVATHAGTVAAGWLEIEAGTEFDRNEDGTHDAMVPVGLKIGLASRLQLNVQMPFVRPAGETMNPGDLAIACKWRLVDRAPIVGAFAILPSIKVPSGSAESSTGTTDVNLLLISSHQLGAVEMDLNVGYTRRSGDATSVPRQASLWAAAFGGPARGPLGWTAEIYGYPATSGPAGTASIVAFLGGPTVQVRTWLALDTGVILPIAGPQSRAIYFGGVYNVGKLWN